MSIVGETLACRQKSRNVQDRYEVTVVRTDTETDTVPVVPPRLQASAMENILPIFSFFVVHAWWYHRQAGFYTCSTCS